MKKIVISFVTLLSVVFLFLSGKGYADEVNSVETIEQYVTVENNQFYLNLPKKLENNFTEQVKQVLKEKNEYIKVNDLVIDPVTKKISDKYSHYRFFSVNDSLEFFWWGARRTFYDDSSAKEWAHILRGYANLNQLTAIADALVLPQMGILNAGAAWWGNTVASSVEYNADLDGDGCVLDTNYWLTFSCYPR